MTRTQQLSMNTAILVAAMIGLALVGAASGQKPDPAPGVPLPVREQNLGPDGAIRVHEQGTANVNVTNQALAIDGNVSVDNFPTEMNVNVTGGSLPMAPASKAFIQSFFIDPDNTVHQFPFPETINATTVTVYAGSNPEVQIAFLTPLASWGSGGPLGLDNTVLYLNDFEGTGHFNHSFSKSFSQPIPINAIAIRCANESESCGLFVTVVGS